MIDKGAQHRKKKKKQRGVIGKGTQHRKEERAYHMGNGYHGAGKPTRNCTERERESERAKGKSRIRERERTPKTKREKMSKMSKMPSVHCEDFSGERVIGVVRRGWGGRGRTARCAGAPRPDRMRVDSETRLCAVYQPKSQITEKRKKRVGGMGGKGRGCGGAEA